jgi:hypothetical protein
LATLVFGTRHAPATRLAVSLTVLGRRRRTGYNRAIRRGGRTSDARHSRTGLFIAAVWLLCSSHRSAIALRQSPRGTVPVPSPVQLHLGDSVHRMGFLQRSGPHLCLCRLCSSSFGRHAVVCGGYGDFRTFRPRRSGGCYLHGSVHGHLHHGGCARRLRLCNAASQATRPNRGAEVEGRGRQRIRFGMGVCDS